MARKLTLLAFPAVLLLASTSLPAVADQPEAYVGLGYGQYRFEFDDEDLDSSFDDDQAVLKAFVGGQFTEAFGLEFTYLNFDEASDNDLNAEIDGWSIAGVFSAPLHDNFDIYGKLGWFAWEAEYTGQAAVGNVLVDVQGDIDGDDIFYGAGLRFGLSDAVDLRLEYDRYELDDNIDPEMDTLSASLQFNF